MIEIPVFGLHPFFALSVNAFWLFLFKICEGQLFTNPPHSGMRVFHLHDVHAYTVTRLLVGSFSWSSRQTCIAVSGCRNVFTDVQRQVWTPAWNNCRDYIKDLQFRGGVANFGLGRLFTFLYPRNVGYLTLFGTQWTMRTSPGCFNILHWRVTLLTVLSVVSQMPPISETTIAVLVSRFVPS